MNRTSALITVVAGIVCFIAGFVFANFLNRSELSDLRGENERLKAGQTEAAKTSQEVTLSLDEIDTKLTEAERNSTNFSFQKSLGLGLYRYGAIKQDKTIIEKALPVLERAYSLDSNDYDVIVGLGNSYYDIGYFGKDNPSFERSREFYRKALAARPADVEVRTDLGLTYFLQDPPDYQAAISEFEKSLAVDPKHEKTLSFAALALKNQNLDATKYSEVLRSVNPNSPTLKEISGQAPSVSSNIP
jgi:tetratricopeptide (TPR) repeat protein